jgi:hypothetical protein
MAIHVYITDQCKKDIDRQQYTSIIRAFKDKIEKSQHSGVFDRFPPPYLKKRFERQVRLVAKECLLGADSVVVFLRLLVRGGSEYAAFGGSGYKILPGSEKLMAELTDDALGRYVQSRAEPVPPPPPAPTKEESEYLHSALSASQDIYRDFHCCETKLWVDTIAGEEFTNRLSLFVEPIFETIDSSESGLAEARCKQDKRFGILYRRVPEQKTVILFTPFKDKPPRARVQELYADLLADGLFNMEAVLKRSKRAYPQELLLNEDAWFRVQKDKEGNMALSLEEIDVLESARAPKGGYPLFINGRAGSGKSTILQYLFSEYLYHHFERMEGISAPVLFACNDELLARSASSVRAILQVRHGRREQAAGSFNDWIGQFEDAFNDSFRNFHSWLKTLCPRDVFAKDKLIDYGRFKHWWEGRFSREPSARKLFDADISWHVIRTYIKGISPEGYLDPDDYLEIPTKQKSVTPETYQIVFDKVWKRYLDDQKEKGLWDHQDLARYMLENDVVKPHHPVVFCDEAQDFTRIELEILHRLCLFNARTMHSYDLARIPLAFAGDPFQTLNPTGFRWEATKAFFTEKFLKTFPGQMKRELNYRELTYNYRSSRHIVKFCNSIQLVRSVAFNFPEIKPQHPWEDEEDAPSVSYYERGDLEVLKTLKNQSEIRIIVPCEEGGEGEWARENGLADFVEFDEADVPKNVVSPTGVKGLEFPRVVLFGFGGACPAALRRAISESSEPLDGDQAIEPQYFLNRLYVAASRPRKRLFIIDSASHIEGFWNQIFANQDAFIVRSENVSEWEVMTGQIIKGSLESWEGDKEDSFDTADKLEREGRLRKDRILLRQAAQSYDTAKKPILAKKCRSEALELEERFLDAARIWQEIQEFDRSVAAAWHCGEGGYKFIVEVAAARPDLKSRIHFKFASFLLSEGSMNDGVALLKDLVQVLEDVALREEVLTSADWREAIESCLKRMLGTNALETGLWKVAYTSASALVKAGVNIPKQTLGDVAFRGDLMKEAFGHWEEIPADQRSKFERSFLRAKAASLDYPQNLEVFGELLTRHRNRKDAGDILIILQREGTEKLKAPQRETMLLAHFIIGECDRVYAALNEVTSMPFLLEILERALRDDSSTVIPKVLFRIANILADQDRWQEFIEAFKTGKLKDLKSDALKPWASRFPNLHSKPFIETVVGSNRIEGVRNDLKTNLADLLRERFGNGFPWKNDIHPLLVGRAFERAGLFKETLPYYESMATSSLLSDATKRVAWQRWAKTKGLQAARERELNAIGRADKIYKEALEKAESYGFNAPEAIPEELPSPLPVIDPEPLVADIAPERAAGISDTKHDVENVGSATDGNPAGPASPRFGRTLQAGDLEVRVSPDGQRINIQHTDTLEQASIHVARKAVMIEGEAVAVDSEQRATISRWDLTVCFSNLPKGKIALQTSDGLEVMLPVAVGTNSILQ